MANKQAEKHELGRNGEVVANGVVGGKTTKHKAPFDVVDFEAGFAYEVKSMSALSKDFKVHISDASMARKTKFADQYGLAMILMVVVIHGVDKVEVYRSGLVQHIRVSQMELIKGGV